LPNRSTGVNKMKASELVEIIQNDFIDVYGDMDVKVETHFERHRNVILKEEDGILYITY